MERGRGIKQTLIILGLVITGLFSSTACAPSSRGDDKGGEDDPQSDDPNDDPPNDNSGFIDAAPRPDVSETELIDAGNIYPDANGNPNNECMPGTCPPPPDDGCGTQELCNNGSDDDCDGKVDENCACSPGAVQSCFANVPGKRNVGACKDGQQTCQGSGESTGWGPCTGGIQPSAEACDSLDNDCNGCVDDAEECCNVDLECPAKMPDGAPFTDYVINGTQFYQGPVSNWTWTVTGGPCDQLLAPNVSFTLNGTKTGMVSGAGLSTLTFRATLSGDYTVRVQMALPDGTTIECVFIVHITGPGLRVELCWDHQGSTDVDLHVHKPGTTTPWFTTDGTDLGDSNPDDCYYGNCKANSFSPIDTDSADFGNANSPLAECSGVPFDPFETSWNDVGYCPNPRLDTDNITDVGRAENINIDNPVNGKTYRVAVHYYNGNATVSPMINVYCGGTLLATYGKAPDTVPGFTNGDNLFAKGTIWRVVDVTTTVNTAGETTGCNLDLLHPAGQTSGYRVTCPNNATCVDNSY